MPDDCGCPPPQIPVMRAAVPAPTVSEKDLPPTVHLAQPGEEAKPVPPPDSASGMRSQDAPESQATVTIAPPGTTDLPAPSPNAPHAQVDAPFVFRAGDVPPTSAPDLGTETLPMSRSASPVPVLTMAEPPARTAAQGCHEQGKGLLLIHLQVGRTLGVRPRTSAWSDVGAGVPPVLVCDEQQGRYRIEPAEAMAEVRGPRPEVQRPRSEVCLIPGEWLSPAERLSP